MQAFGDELFSPAMDENKQLRMNQSRPLATEVTGIDEEVIAYRNV